MDTKQIFIKQVTSDLLDEQGNDNFTFKDSVDYRKLNIFSTLNCGSMSDYNITHWIGKGAYAVVKLGMHKPTGENRAIKMYERFKLIDSTRKSSLVREIKIMSWIQHPNIVKFYESIDSSQFVYLVMEYLPGISLLKHLKNQPDR